MVYSTFACISRRIDKKINSLPTMPKRQIIVERPINDAVFAVAVKRHFGNHPPFDRHVRPQPHYRRGPIPADAIAVNLCPHAKGDKRKRRHKINFIEIVFGQLHTLGHQLGAFLIMGAAAALLIEQIANNIGKDDFTAIFVLQFHQTAFGTAIAQGLHCAAVISANLTVCQNGFSVIFFSSRVVAQKLTRPRLSASLSQMRWGIQSLKIAAIKLLMRALALAVLPLQVLALEAVTFATDWKAQAEQGGFIKPKRWAYMKKPVLT